MGLETPGRLWEPGLEQSILAQYDASLVEAEYDGVIEFKNGAIIIRGQYECGTFVLVKRPGLRQRKEVPWAAKCLANTVVELRLKSPIGSPPPPSPPAQVAARIENQERTQILDIPENKGIEGTKHQSNFLAFPVDYELLGNRTHPK